MLPDQTKHYIGGDFVSPEDGQVFETVDSSTNAVLSTVARDRAAGIDRAVSATWEAYNSSWSEAQASKRQRLLLSIGIHRLGDRRRSKGVCKPSLLKAYLSRSCQSRNGEIITGGSVPADEDLDGCFVEPTLITGVDHDATPSQEEIFKSVLTVFQWEDDDDMIYVPNDVDFGLAAGVITDDISNANTPGQDFEAGYVWINTYHDLVSEHPGGGYKQSSIGREVGAETLKHYQQTKTINLSVP